MTILCALSQSPLAAHQRDCTAGAKSWGGVDAASDAFSSASVIACAASRSFRSIAHECIRLLRRVLADQDRAVGLFLAIKLARLRQAHRAQVIGRVAGRHLPGGDDVHQSPDALALSFFTAPAHVYSAPAAKPPLPLPWRGRGGERRRREPGWGEACS